MRGDIDSDTAAQLWQYLGYLIGQGHHHIVLDLRGIILIDSVGVDVITKVSAWARRRGGDLVLRSGASPAVAEQLAAACGTEARGGPSLEGGRLIGAAERRHHREEDVPDDRAMPPQVIPRSPSPAPRLAALARHAREVLKPRPLPLPPPNAGWPEGMQMPTRVPHGCALRRSRGRQTGAD
jgi:anti-anti-sigma factor